MLFLLEETSRGCEILTGVEIFHGSKLRASGCSSSVYIYNQIQPAARIALEDGQQGFRMRKASSNILTTQQATPEQTCENAPKEYPHRYYRSEIS